MLIKQISTKTVFGDKEKILETVMTDKTKEHFLYRTFGVIEGHSIGKGRHKRVNRETGEAEDTSWTRFFGTFFAKNAAGQEFEAAATFLPEYVSGQFVTGLIGDGDVAAIEFAYDIYAVYNKESITSYEFVAQAVRRSDEPDRMDAMKQAMLGSMPNAKQIAAPKK